MTVRQHKVALITSLWAVFKVHGSQSMPGPLTYFHYHIVMAETCVSMVALRRVGHISAIDCSSVHSEHLNERCTTLEDTAYRQNIAMLSGLVRENTQCSLLCRNIFIILNSTCILPCRPVASCWDSQPGTTWNRTTYNSTSSSKPESLFISGRAAQCHLSDFVHVPLNSSFVLLWLSRMRTWCLPVIVSSNISSSKEYRMTRGQLSVMCVVMYIVSQKWHPLQY